MHNYPNIAIQVGEILLPSPNVDKNKWAVIACDQFTSQPEYWEQVARIVGDSPSTLNLILPEVYLGAADEGRRISAIHSVMQRYLNEGIFTSYEGLIYVEREVDGKTRHGLMMALDLEQYDFHAGSQSLIRATEGTIIDRLPPRIRIREGAILEIPHILVLIDDPEKTVIEPLASVRERMAQLYDVELMLGSGYLRGYLVQSPNLENQVTNALARLASPKRFRHEYGVNEEQDVLLFALGDGNHSLATAKSIWEKMKTRVRSDHPARYALVEVENLHDQGLTFEPIHRILYGAGASWKEMITNYFHGKVRYEPISGKEELISTIRLATGKEQVAGIITERGQEIVFFQEPASNLAVGTLQSFLDEWVGSGGARRIDYVHGDDVVWNLAKQPANLGFYLPSMEKSELFKTVIIDGSLPRKTFSMGEAHEKRFYMECRRIV